MKHKSAECSMPQCPKMTNFDALGKFGLKMDQKMEKFGLKIDKVGPKIDKFELKIDKFD